MSRPEIEPSILASWEFDNATMFANPPPALSVVFANPIVLEKFQEADLAVRWLRFYLIEIDLNIVDKFIAAFNKRVLIAPSIWDLAQKTLALYKKSTTVTRHPISFFIGLNEDERLRLYETYTKIHS